MPHASFALLTDVFTFLAFLHADDIAPMRTRFLAPSALAKLDTQLRLPDGLVYARPRRGGKRGATERDTERIRFIHFLCEAADLVALTGRFLKPTPRAAHWLNHSSFDRLAELFDAFCNGLGTAQELWHAYRLPASPATLAALVGLLREVPRDEHIRFATLLKLIPIVVFQDGRGSSPDVILRDLIRWLEWFGAIEIGPRGALTVQLTALGANLLRRADAPTLPADPLPQPVKIRRGLEITVPPHAHLPTLYELADYTTPSPAKRRASGAGVRVLDRTRIERALERGVATEHILQFLETAIRDALPVSVAQTLHAWTDDFGAVSLRHTTLLEVREPARLEEIGSSRAARACLGRTLSPRAVIVRQARLPALIRQLERLGMRPRVEFPRRQHTSRPSDYPTVLHLYLAARLGYELADLIPAPYRVPYAIVAELEQQLAPSDRTLAEELVSEWQQSRRVVLAKPAPPRNAEPSALHAAQVTVEQIERAIAANTPLRITYHTASRNETTTRVVEPFRVEWRGEVPYLIAYCRTRQDERVFRLDRILKLSRAAR